ASDVADVSFVSDPDSSLSGWVWRLREPLALHGVRILKPDDVEQGGARDAQWTLQWMRSDTEAPSRRRRFSHWWLERDRSATVWINDPVCVLRVPHSASVTPPAPPELYLITQPVESYDHPAMHAAYLMRKL